MLKEELISLVKQIQDIGCEGQHLEVKSAHLGFPRIYNTLSSFSNQNRGGIIVCGLDEINNFEVVGVYDSQDLIHKISDQCKQMEPNISVTTTECLIDGKTVVSIEVPSAKPYDRPVYYKGLGLANGSYKRIADANELMNDWEIYNYQSYKMHIKNDLRTCSRDSDRYVNEDAMFLYLSEIKKTKPNTQNISDEELKELLGLYKNGQPTLANLLCFNKLPQIFYPQLCVTAVVTPGRHMGEVDEKSIRFLTNKKIEGTIKDMVDQSVSFVNMNMKHPVAFINGVRIDKPQYPLNAIREAILNALVHRDYSVHTDAVPVRLEMYEDRIEIINPGGIYGAINIDELGRVYADTRNATLVSILETQHVVENRFSGIPTIRKELKEADLPSPIFVNKNGLFKIIIYNATKLEKNKFNAIYQKVIEFCSIPRTRKELSNFIGQTQYYSMKTVIEPLIAQGQLFMTNPDKPKSKLQRYFSSYYND